MAATVPSFTASSSPITHSIPKSLEECRALDAADPLRSLKDQFSLPAGKIYLDGNSLGVMPKATAGRVAEVVTQEWGVDLIASWNKAGWVDLPQRLGNQFAPWIGAKEGQVVFTDTTSSNLFKVLTAATNVVKADHPRSAEPNRKLIISERCNFPTDLYIAQSVAKANELDLVMLEPEEIHALFSGNYDAAKTPITSDATDVPIIPANVAILLLTHVNYRTGAMYDMKPITAAAHASGTIAVWDLCHSSGAVPVDLLDCDADYAVGCSYKYLNGGPGAPAFVFAHPRLAGRFWQPLSGWWGHNSPFTFTPTYEPAPGIGRFLCGAQPIISMSALQCGLDIFAIAAKEEFGGMDALRKKSLALTDLFIALVEERCGGLGDETSTYGLGLATPRDHKSRGSQVCLTRRQGKGVNGNGSGAYAIVQALIHRGVIGDFRKGDGKSAEDEVHLDILRFGFTPLYVGYEDVWNAVEHLREVLEKKEWELPEFNEMKTVT